MRFGFTAPLLTGILWLVSSPIFAAGGPATTDPAKADADFADQGEYVGKLKDKEGKEETWGGHLIALGGGNFRAVGYPGGLPGDGWNGKDRPAAEGKREGDKIICRNDDVRVEFAGGKATIFAKDGPELGTMTKTERKSCTLGATPPKDAVVLYAGPESVENWENGKASDDGFLTQGVTSKKKAQSFSIHLEFRLPYMPAAQGQGRGNSGYYVQGRYEVQMLDSFGLEGKADECGGVYGAAPPRINMCYPPLAWQTYDIDFTAAQFENGQKKKNARLTVRHNGVVIHEDIELPKGTPGGLGGESPEPGPVFLQDHGNPVRYRNIWLVEKP